MDQALSKVGLPVKCAYGDCKAKSLVRPQSDYGGWYKSKLFRYKQHLRWFCPKHYEKGREIDNKFYENYQTPDPYPQEEIDKTQDELYKLLDEGEEDNDDKSINSVS